MSVKSSTEIMLYVVLTMPTLNKAYLFIYYYLAKKSLYKNTVQNRQGFILKDGIYKKTKYVITCCRLPIPL